MELYVTIDEFKDHIHLERSYKEEDDYLISLLESAHAHVETIIQQPLVDKVKEGKLHPSLYHAIRIYAATLYDHREAVGFGQLTVVPHTFNALVKPHIKYK